MKPKSSRGASTRQRIIAAAAKLMYKNGVNGTSVDDVLAASGTGKSQFYHYFGSKEALVKELIEYHLASLPAPKDDVLSRLTSTEGFEAWLDQIADDHRQGLYAEGCPIGNLASEMAGLSETLRVDLQSTFAQWETALSEGFARLKAQGVLRAEVSPPDMAMFCVAAIEGALLLCKTEKASGPIEATVSHLKLYLRAQAVGASKRRGPLPGSHKLTFVP